MKEDTERTPLRTILTNFLNHIDTLENQRTPDNTYESEFQELKLFSESIKGTKQYSCSEGEKEVNRKKNRYKDILPFDCSRVVLNEYAGVPGSDYINANLIKGASGSPAYIACQGPLPHTVNDFWRMVVQCEVQVIVMACNEEEAGKHKCENYWVSEEGEEKQLGMVSLRLLKASTVCPDFSVRTMRLKYTNNQANTEERTVCQFHYSAWPDHGVPPLVRPLLDMVRLVRDTQASETLPVLIHCSAGCGRTGTICAIDYVWGLLRAGKLTKDFSLLFLVREMRKQRIAMVQTKEQYVLVHRAVRELFREQLRMIDSHPYENIDCNGLPLIKCPSPSPEPTYDNISNLQNNKAEEKQDEKEKKEQAPPLPKKKRFQTLSSKQAKEVENLSERQRQLERESGSRPRVAALQSLFERRQVARSHSLGSVRQPQPPPQTNAVDGKALPIPGRGILRVPQPQPRPALPVKRSKSLRVLGSSDRGKLSIPPTPANADPQRRLSLESNYEEMKDLVEGGTGHNLSVDSIVAGLGVRERSNSFRRAVANETLTSRQPKPGQLMRSHTSVDMRSSRGTPVTKPLLRPKPNIHPGTSLTAAVLNKLTSDMKPGVKNLGKQQSSPQSELKESQSSAPAPHSLSLRREDCRVSYSSGESTVSTSSDQGGISSHLSKTRQITSAGQYHTNVDNLNPAFRQDPASSSFISPREHSQFIKQPVMSHSTPPGRPEKSNRSLYHKINLPSDSKQNSVPQNVRYLVYDPKGPKQNTAAYAAVSKPFPPPYVEPGKNAQKPRSSPHAMGDKQPTPASHYSEVYGKLQEQTHWLAGYSSRDLVLAAHSSASKPSTSSDRLGVPDTSVTLSTNHSERRNNYENYATPRKKSYDRREEQVLLHDLGISANERRYQQPESHLKTERRPFEQDQSRIPADKGSKALIEKITKEPSQQNSSSLYSKSFKDRRPFNRNLHISPHEAHLKTGSERREHDLLPLQVTEEYRSSQKDTFPKSEDRRLQEAMFHRPRPLRTQESLSPDTPPGGGPGLKMRRGSRDDLALCAGAGASSRVKRQASVVLSRHSLIATPSHPLSIWSQATQANSGGNQPPATTTKDDPWSGAVGVDLDQVAASISTQKDGKMMRAALEALHLRKSSSKSTLATPKASEPAPPPKPGPFRKQQQYL